MFPRVGILLVFIANVVIAEITGDGTPGNAWGRPSDGGRFLTNMVRSGHLANTPENNITQKVSLPIAFSPHNGHAIYPVPTGTLLVSGVRKLEEKKNMLRGVDFHRDIVLPVVRRLNGISEKRGCPRSHAHGSHQYIDHSCYNCNSKTQCDERKECRWDPNDCHGDNSNGCGRCHQHKCYNDVCHAEDCYPIHPRDSWCNNPDNIVPCRDCVSEPWMSCYGIMGKACKDPFLLCDKPESELKEMGLESTVGFAKMKELNHPCANESCQQDRSGPVCSHAVQQFCKKDNSCTPTGCSRFMKTVARGDYNFDSSECAFTDKSVCQNEKCGHYGWNIFESFKLKTCRSDNLASLKTVEIELDKTKESDLQPKEEVGHRRLESISKNKKGRRLGFNSFDRNRGSTNDWIELMKQDRKCESKLDKCGSGCCNFMNTIMPSKDKAKQWCPDQYASCMEFNRNDEAECLGEFHWLELLSVEDSMLLPVARALKTCINDQKNKEFGGADTSRADSLAKALNFSCCPVGSPESCNEDTCHVSACMTSIPEFRDKTEQGGNWDDFFGCISRQCKPCYVEEPDGGLDFPNNNMPATSDPKSETELDFECEKICNKQGDSFDDFECFHDASKTCSKETIAFGKCYALCTLVKSSRSNDSAKKCLPEAKRCMEDDSCFLIAAERQTKQKHRRMLYKWNHMEHKRMLAEQPNTKTPTPSPKPNAGEENNVKDDGNINNKGGDCLNKYSRSKDQKEDPGLKMYCDLLDCQYEHDTNLSLGDTDEHENHSEEMCVDSIYTYCKANPKDPGCLDSCSFDKNWLTRSDKVDPCTLDSCIEVFSTSVSDANEGSCEIFHKSVLRESATQGFVRPNEDSWHFEEMKKNGTLVDKPEKDSKLVIVDGSVLAKMKSKCEKEKGSLYVENILQCAESYIDFCNDEGAWESDACRNLSVCGDGVVTYGERCDDGGNPASGCSEDCTYIESNFVCPNPGKECQMCCMNVSASGKCQSYSDEQTFIAEGSFGKDFTGCGFCKNHRLEPFIQPYSAFSADKFGTPCQHQTCISAAATYSDAVDCDNYVENYCKLMETHKQYDPGCDSYTPKAPFFNVPAVPSSCEYEIVTLNIPFGSIRSYDFALIECPFAVENDIKDSDSPELLVPYWSPIDGLRTETKEALQKNNVYNKLVNKALSDTPSGKLVGLHKITEHEFFPKADVEIHHDKRSVAEEWDNRMYFNNLASITRDRGATWNDVDNTCTFNSNGAPAKGFTKSDCENHGNYDRIDQCNHIERRDFLQLIPPSEDPFVYAAKGVVFDAKWDGVHHNDNRMEHFKKINPGDFPVPKPKKGVIQAILRLSETRMQWRGEKEVPVVHPIKDCFGGGEREKCSTLADQLVQGKLRIQLGNKLFQKDCVDKSCELLIDPCRSLTLKKKTANPDVVKFEKAYDELEKLVDAKKDVSKKYTGKRFEDAKSWSDVVGSVFLTELLGQATAIRNAKSLFEKIAIVSTETRVLKNVHNYCPYDHWVYNEATFTHGENPKYMKDPCCNERLLEYQCCRPRDVDGAKVKVVTGLNKETVGICKDQTKAKDAVDQLVRLQDTVRVAEDLAADSLRTSSFDNFWKFEDLCRNKIERNTNGERKCVTDSDCYCSQSKCSEHKECETPDEYMYMCYAECWYDEHGKEHPEVLENLIRYWSPPKTDIAAYKKYVDNMSSKENFQSAFSDAWGEHMTESGCSGKLSWMRDIGHSGYHWQCDETCTDQRKCDMWNVRDDYNREYSESHNGIWPDLSRRDNCEAHNFVYKCHDNNQQCQDKTINTGGECILPLPKGRCTSNSSIKCLGQSTKDACVALKESNGNAICNWGSHDTLATGSAELFCKEKPEIGAKCSKLGSKDTCNSSANDCSWEVLPCYEERKCYDDCHGPCRGKNACEENKGTWIHHNFNENDGKCYSNKKETCSAANDKQECMKLAEDCAWSASSTCDPISSECSDLDTKATCEANETCGWRWNFDINHHGWCCPENAYAFTDNNGNTNCSMFPKGTAHGWQFRDPTCCKAESYKLAISRFDGHPNKEEKAKEVAFSAWRSDQNQCCLGVWEKNEHCFSGDKHCQKYHCKTHANMWDDVCRKCELERGCSKKRNECWSCQVGRELCCGEKFHPQKKDACLKYKGCNDRSARNEFGKCESLSGKAVNHLSHEHECWQNRNNDVEEGKTSDVKWVTPEDKCNSPIGFCTESGGHNMTEDSRCEIHIHKPESEKEAYCKAIGAEFEARGSRYTNSSSRCVLKTAKTISECFASSIDGKCPQSHTWNNKEIEAPKFNWDHLHCGAEHFKDYSESRNWIPSRFTSEEECNAGECHSLNQLYGHHGWSASQCQARPQEGCHEYCFYGCKRHNDPNYSSVCYNSVADTLLYPGHNIWKDNNTCVDSSGNSVIAGTDEECKVKCAEGGVLHSCNESERDWRKCRNGEVNSVQGSTKFPEKVRDALNCWVKHERCHTRSECEANGKCTDRHEMRTRVCTEVNWPFGNVHNGTECKKSQDNCTHRECPYDKRIDVPGVCIVKRPTHGCGHDLWHSLGCRAYGKAHSKSECESYTGYCTHGALTTKEDCEDKTLEHYTKVEAACANHSLATQKACEQGHNLWVLEENPQWYASATTKAECLGNDRKGCRDKYHRINNVSGEDCAQCGMELVDRYSWMGGIWYEQKSRKLTWHSGGQKIENINQWGPRQASWKLKTELAVPLMKTYARLASNSYLTKFNYIKDELKHILHPDFGGCAFTDSAKAEKVGDKSEEKSQNTWDVGSATCKDHTGVVITKSANGINLITSEEECIADGKGELKSNLVETTLVASTEVSCGELSDEKSASAPLNGKALVKLQTCSEAEASKGRRLAISHRRRRLGASETHVQLSKISGISSKTHTRPLVTNLDKLTSDPILFGSQNNSRMKFCSAKGTGFHVDFPSTVKSVLICFKVDLTYKVDHLPAHFDALDIVQVSEYSDSNGPELAATRLHVGSIESGTSEICTNLTERGIYFPAVCANAEKQKYDQHMNSKSTAVHSCKNATNGSDFVSATLTGDTECVCFRGFSGKDCSVGCLNNCMSYDNRGLCNEKTNECTCNDGYLGVDCGTSKGCPNNCSFNGECNATTGTCTCDSFHTSSDCSTPIIVYDPTKLVKITLTGFGESNLAKSPYFSLSALKNADGSFGDPGNTFGNGGEPGDHASASSSSSISTFLILGALIIFDFILL